MKRTYISEIKEGEKVLLKGFIHALRVQSNIIFLELRDITGITQAIVLKESEAFSKKSEMKLEAIIEVIGTVKKSGSKEFELEVEAEAIEIVSTFEGRTPIPVNRKAGEEVELESRFDYRWLDLRSPENAKIFRLWTSLEAALRSELLKQNFIQVNPPSFMSSPSESGSEVFEVEYFGKKAYLAQSPQFYKQMAIASGFEKVFMFSKVYRAEKSNTSRHLTEFNGFDFEIAYVTGLEDLMHFEENLLTETFKSLATEFIEVNVPKTIFPRIPLMTAKEITKEMGIESTEENDLNSAEEKAIGEYVLKEFGSEFVFITEYPIEIRPFYHMYEETTTRSADLLFKGLEITTLAQREHRIEILEKQALEKGLTLESLEKYLEFFKYSCPPHGGGGVGLDRVVKQILNKQNIKEAVFLPRDVKRLTP